MPGALNVRETLVETPELMLLGAPDAAAKVTVCSRAPKFHVTLPPACTATTRGVNT